MILSKCSVCGIEVRLKNSQQLNYKNNFCSKECNKAYFSLQKIPNCVCKICNKDFYIKPFAKNRNKNIYCSRECFIMARTKEYTGDNNPNKKYVFDTRFLEKIDTYEKAYLLGWIASDGSVSTKDKLSIGVKKSDGYIIKDLGSIINSDIPIKTKKRYKENWEDIIYIEISSKEIVLDVCHHLNINVGKKSDILFFDLNLYPREIQVAFVQAYFEGDGTISHLRKDNKYPTCSIASNSLKMLESIQKCFGGNINKNSTGYKLGWSGNNCLDFLGTIYENPKYKLQRKYELYLQWSSWIPSLQGYGEWGYQPLFKWNKSRKDAQPPYKANPSDSGWDLTLLEKIKEVGDVEFYSTGIKVCPDYGWYFDLVPRSSISKTDYMLANGIGIIDRAYVGEVIVPLRRMKENPNPLELPGRYVQIIPRPIVHGEILEVDDIGDTLRGEGGFGSSNITKEEK